MNHQQDAIPYFEMRITQMIEAEEDDDAAYWSAVKMEAQRQVDAGEWQPRSIGATK